MRPLHAGGTVLSKARYLTNELSLLGGDIMTALAQHLVLRSGTMIEILPRRTY
jgi:hypothetical protein